jgi:HAD superfamily hydrolase (TIGR01509 family)
MIAIAQGGNGSPSRIDLVIFDCDGVLIDSEIVACRVDAVSLAEIGIDVTVDDILERYVGISTATMLADIAERHRVTLPGGFADELHRRVLAAFETELQAIPGIAETLDALPHQVCVASSSTPARLLHALSLARLIARFDPHIFSATQVERGKPAPDLFLFAAGKMGADPAHCLVIEDSLAGVAAARAAGMIVFGFTGGGHCRPGHGDRLREAGAAAVFGEMPSLPTMLGF